MLKKAIAYVYPGFNARVNLIFTGILITNISTFMLNAFLTIYMNTHLGYTPGAIGVVLTISLISQRGFTFFGGIFADRLGIKKIMIVGLVFRSIGYFSYIFAVEYYLLIFSSIIVGLGGALLAPSLSASITLFAEDKRMDAFAYQGIVVNLAATIGPLIGSVVYSVSYKSIFIATSLTHLLFIFIIARISYHGHANTKKQLKAPLLGSLLVDKKLVLFTLAISLFWYLQTQLNLTIPLYVSDFTDDRSLIGLVYSLNGFLVIAFQYLLINTLRRRMKKEHIICLGQLLLGVSFGSLIIFTTVPYSLIIFCIFFSIGGMCVAPMINEFTVSMASKEKLATYIGFVSFGWAIGGSVGNMTGGWLYEYFSNQQAIGTLWTFYFVIGLASSVFLFLFMRKFFR